MKSHAVRTATLTLLVAGLLGCGTEPEAQPGVPQLINARQSACKGSSIAPSTGSANVEATASGSDLLIVHRDASYNCAAKVAMTGTVSGTDILVTETITNPNDTMARCMCPFDLSVEVKGLAAGTYQVSVLDAQGEAVGSTSVTIGQGAVTTSTQSACKAATKGYADGNLDATVTAGALEIVHRDAAYNCAAKIQLTAQLSGSSIRVKETVENPGEQAKCMCPFDLTIAIKGLPAGSYNITVVDAAGQEVGTIQVAIP